MILVLGGLGYIGSHMIQYLKDYKYEFIVADNLSTGHRKSIDKNIKFYFGDIRNKIFLKEIFSNNNIDSVIHFCADSLVKESMINPLKYYDNNIIGAINLFSTMLEFNVKNIIFFFFSCCVWRT